jgi:membrane protease subunit HflK
MPVFLINRFGAPSAPIGRHVRGALAAQPANTALSLNDPRWGHDAKPQEGRKPNKPENNDGPPDLDQLWRDFNVRINRLLGGKRNGNGGGDGGGPFRPNARGMGLGAALGAGIAVVIWMASGSFIVQDGQVGVVTTFGKLSHTVGPGFNWRFPAPFQAHDIVNTAQVQTAEIGYRTNVRNKQASESLMLTSDANIVDIQMSVRYKVKDPVAWVFNNRDQEQTVRDDAETVVRELVGKTKFDAVLYESRDQLSAEARQAIQRMADQYGLGAEIVGVTMQSVQPPDQVAAAFQDASKALEERSRARSEAQAYADDIVPQAKARAAALVKDAEGYRASVEDTATGVAARFDQIATEYAKAPVVTRDRMYIDTMQQVFANTSKVMIDAKTGTNQIYLPLDRMMAQGAANRDALGSRSGPMMAPAPGQAPLPAPAQMPSQTMPAQADGVPAATATTPPAPATPSPSELLNGESQRTHDLRSRETGRERESR